MSGTKLFLDTNIILYALNGDESRSAGFPNPAENQQ